MPALAKYLASQQGNTSQNKYVEPENVALYLPSQIAIAETRVTLCGKFLIKIEEDLRVGQAHDALDDLRRQLRNRMFANQFKVKNVVGQHPLTRARKWQATIDDRVIVAKHNYRRARAALLTLRGPGHWEEELQELLDDDVRALNERALTEQEKANRAHMLQAVGHPNAEEVLSQRVDGTVQLGEGQRTISWIWYQGGLVSGEGDDLQMHEALRIEWAKACARALRWWEEVVLLDEEMRRSIEFCEWQAKWWVMQDGKSTAHDGGMREGLSAYAAEQAAANRALTANWTLRWADVRRKAKDVVDSDALPTPSSFSGDSTTSSGSSSSITPIIDVFLEEEDEGFGDGD
ncbi:hypothetical protein CERSUDRAFT_57000 [Gelatoporia subvermispora B]|uniref:Uncharacterized protein n=1 Tax=Ceriporiopsis subvermispora (strain B) TaxID=914234 RepID=M2Q9C3_CERS8|nr:hypothetical protein CERSUDRAFT_57000 [Gelatoporia subvermispora B]